MIGKRRREGRRRGDKRKGEERGGLVFKIPLLHNCKEKTDNCHIITSAMPKKQQKQNRNIPKIQQTENVFP